MKDLTLHFLSAQDSTLIESYLFEASLVPKGCQRKSWSLNESYLHINWSAYEYTN